MVCDRHPPYPINANGGTPLTESVEKGFEWVGDPIGLSLQRRIS